MPYAAPTNPHVYLRIDWNDDGTFASTYDDVSADVLKDSITSELGRDQGRLLGGPKVPAAAWAFTNESRNYASAYSGSPLRGYLQPGHKCVVGRILGDATVSMTDTVVSMADPEALMAGTSDTPIFTGHTDEGVEHYAIAHRTVEMRGYGLIQRLLDIQVTISYQGSITTGAALLLVLQAAGLAATEYIIDPSAITSGRVLLNWHVDDRAAWDVCREIWATEGPPAALYEDGSGILHFEGWGYRTLNARCTTVQQTFSDQSGVTPFVTIEYRPSYDSVINDLTLDNQVRAFDPITKVWEYGSVLTLAPLESKSVIAKVNDVVRSPQAPVVLTDYTLDVPGSLTSVSIIVIGPKTFQVTLVAGAGGAVVNPVGSNHGFQIRAEPLVVLSTATVTGTVDTTASRARYGKRQAHSELQQAIWPSLSPATASGLIDGYLSQYAEPRGVVKISLDGYSYPLLREILTRSVSDRIHVHDSWSGIDLDVSVEQIEHAIEDRNTHRCVLTCERITEIGWAIWDVSKWDFSIWGQ